MHLCFVGREQVSSIATHIHQSELTVPEYHNWMSLKGFFNLHYYHFLAWIVMYNTLFLIKFIRCLVLVNNTFLYLFFRTTQNQLLTLCFLASTPSPNSLTASMAVTLEVHFLLTMWIVVELVWHCDSPLKQTLVNVYLTQVYQPVCKALCELMIDNPNCLDAIILTLVL